MRRCVGLVLLVLVVAGLAALVSIVGWSAVRQNWANDEPWFTGLQLAPLSTPLAALIAAGVAVTTARWGLHSARATRENDHNRWEADRNAERQRWEVERQLENARRHTERRDATERTLRDRFHELVKLLASSDLRAREGAAYAVVALADDWKAHYDEDEPIKARAEQQVCINVLIAQLRDPLPASMDKTERAHLAAFKQVVQKILRSRLGKVDGGKSQPGAWSSFEFVFDGCTFHNLDLHQCVLSGANVSFNGAEFSGERASFNGSEFSGERTSFDHVKFTSRRTSFERVRFTGWRVSFVSAEFTGAMLSFRRVHFAAQNTWFSGAQFAGKRASFAWAQFRGEVVLFDDALFTAPQVSFSKAQFIAGKASFSGAHFAGEALSFHATQFAGRRVSFNSAHFIGKHVLFDDAQFSSDRVSFVHIRFTQNVSFNGSRFTGSLVDARYTVAFFPRRDLSSRITNHFEDEGALFEVDSMHCPQCEICTEIAAAKQAG